MVNILRRRAMMVQASGSPSGPRYKLKQGTSSFTGRNTTITGSHIVDNNTSGSTGSRHMYITTTTGGSAVPSTTWFTLYAGDTVVYKAKNISYANRYTSGVSSSTIRLRDTSGTTIAGGFSFSLPKNSSGTLEDSEETAVIGSDTNVGSVYLYLQRNSSLEYDLEIWVNGVQYV